MGEKVISAKADRLISLDVFRGITIAGMILVNNPGNWSTIYKPLGHAKWHGWTPTDLIFPFFLYIVGVAITLSFDRRLAQGQSHLRLFEQVVRRSIILFLLGLIMATKFPYWMLMIPYVLVIVGLGFLFADEPPLSWGKTPAERRRKVLGWLLLVAAVVLFIAQWGRFEESKVRVPGVLQRIALCYFFAAVIVMKCGIRGRALWATFLIVAYWAIVKLVPAPEGYTAQVLGPEGLLHDWVDVKIFGTHLYRERPDPEGLLSTLPAIATTLLGVLTGNWLTSKRSTLEKVAALFFAANVALFVGICMDYWFPINKKIWTSSYVVFTAGMALHFLAMCIWLIDIQGFRRWCWPFLVYGTNSILVYFLSGMMARVLADWKLTRVIEGEISQVSLKSWLYETFFASWASPLNASLGFAIAYVVLWLLLLVPLYRRKIFIKI